MAAAAVAVLVVLAGSWFGFRKLSQPACGETVRLSVGAAPELVAPLQAEAEAWANDARQADGCIEIEITASDPADMAAAIAAQSKATLTGVGQANGKTKVPDVWVPDSSMWLQRLRMIRPDSVPSNPKSIARSPIVLAMPEPLAGTVGWPQAKITFPALLQKLGPDSKMKIGIVEPTRDASGLAGLLAMSAAAQASGPTATQTATGLLRALAQGRSSLRQDLLQKFPRASDPASLAGGLSIAPLSEQAVIAYNAVQPPVRLAPLYVEPGPAPLDYPFVTMNNAKAAAAAEFYKALGGENFRDRLAGIGMRGADGTAGKGFQTPSGAPANLVTASQAADGATIEKLLGTWQAISLPARMLAVVDVSGSMLEPVPTANNVTRMAVTSEAARKGMSLFDDSWAVGLWTFSTKLDGDKDYKELVPIGPLTSQRTALLQALSTIKPKPQGDTGLYDTILAGYKAVQDGWDGGRINSLVVLTDGQNDDAVSLTIDQLIAELQKIADPSRPIMVILIGMGTTVAKAEMERITKTIGGGTFVAPDPAKIGEIFLQAISLRSIQR